MKIAKLNIEGYIGGADIMAMLGGEPTFNLSQLKTFLDGLEPDVTDIHVYINSGGGIIDEGFAIYDKLATSKYNITTIGEGMVGSIATVIYMAGSVRRMYKNSKFFIHQPYWQPSAPTPMEADDLTRLGSELKAEQDKILNFYVEKTGANRATLEGLMSDATSLTTDKAIELGFVQSVIEEQVNFKQFKLVACINQATYNKSKMDKSIAESIKDGFKNLTNLFKNKFLNMNLKATDANGQPVELVIESDTEDLVGKPAFIVDASGAQTPAPDGDYTDEQGRIITVLSGNVGEVSTPEEETAEETMAALNAKVTELTNANTTLTSQLEAEKIAKNNLQTTLNAFQPEFDKLKNTLIGAGFDFENPEQSFKGEKKADGYGAAMLERIKSKNL